jgi:hypothetical protein
MTHHIEIKDYYKIPNERMYTGMLTLGVNLFHSKCLESANWGNCWMFVPIPTITDLDQILLLSQPVY